ALAIVERAIDELRETNPGREIRLESNAAALSGSWDPDRVSQLVSNLVSNALQYGARDAPVTVSLSGDAAGALEVRVHNRRPALLPYRAVLAFTANAGPRCDRAEAPPGVRGRLARGRGGGAAGPRLPRSPRQRRARGGLPPRPRHAARRGERGNGLGDPRLD